MKPITIKLHQEMVDAIEKVHECKGEGKAQFVRTAIYERLEKLGYTVPAAFKFPAARKGVGGKPTHLPTKINSNESEAAFLKDQVGKIKKNPQRKVDPPNDASSKRK